jgi:adenosylcobinamide kinase / adenosylcobinamide-phosphate guanylyltransferase
MRTLVTGGIKSGKSSYALELARGFPAPRRFLATAEAFDDEMRERIERHKAERSADFETVEEPLAIHEALADRMIVDCVTMWVNNMFYRGKEDEIDSVLDAFIRRLPPDIVIVTNEVGLGFVPESALSRRYGIALGRANARLAAACDRVVLMVAGIPLELKRPA